jgi:hypothetical protein
MAHLQLIFPAINRHLKWIFHTRVKYGADHENTINIWLVVSTPETY